MMTKNNPPYKDLFFTILKNLLFTVIYSLVAMIALYFFSQNKIVSIIWPPSGLALAGLLIGGKNLLFGIFFGAFFVNFFSGLPAETAFFIAIGNSLEAWFGFFILNRIDKFDNTLSSLKSFLKLILIAGFTGSIIGALFGSTTLYVSGFISNEKYFMNLVQWWMGDSLGIILIAPLILVWSDFSITEINPQRAIKVVLICVINFLAGQIIFMNWFRDTFISQFAFGYWMFFIIAIAAVVFQNRIILFLLIMTAIQALVGAHYEIGFFAHDKMNTQMANYWFYMIILTMVGMTLSTYFTERNKVEEALKKSEEQLMTAQLIAHLGHFEFDPKENTVKGSLELYRIFGLNKNENTLQAFADAVHPDDREYDLNYIQRGIDFGESWDIEHRLLINHGVLKHVRAIGQAILDSNGKTSLLFGTVQDITDQKKAEELLNHSLREKEALIRELYHRTKNTLQLIEAMLILQAGKFAENKELQELVNKTDQRINAILIVHGMLYQSKDLSRISISSYIKELILQIFQNFSIGEDRISMELNIEDQDILLDTAVPFGLVLNELITNSIQHAFVNRDKGKIMISLSKSKSGHLCLNYSDNGVGVPADFNFREQATLGMKFIFSIGEEQMQGKISFENNKGIKCVFDFPMTLYRPRV